VAQGQRRPYEPRPAEGHVGDRDLALGGHVERCEDCAHERIAYNSCRNRHCPKCQAAAARQWLEDRQAELLPVPYYHVVFTLPAAIGAVAFQNKAAVYDLLFRTAAETLTTLAADPKHLGARIGLTAVLHTWGSALAHHPHIHVIAPGGGLSPDAARWIACKPGFFLPVRVLSRLFRRLFLEGLAALNQAGRLAFFGDELRGKVGDGVNQAADLISATASIPSLNFIPLTTFGNWF
jgi:hypothetical protein